MAVILKVNGEAVPGELIEAERVRLSALDGWETIQDPGEHVLALRTPNSKIVYNYDWAASVYQFPTGVSNLPDLAHSEYYNLQSDPGERTNLQNSQSTSVSAAAQTTYAGLISSELQAPLPTVNGINLSTVMNSAGQAYTAFIAPPVGLSVSYGQNTLTITATGGVSAGPKITVAKQNQPPTNYYIQDTQPVPPTASQPFIISVMLLPGSYQITLTNTSGSSATTTLSV